MSDYHYVVRGACIYCVYGTHMRQLDMPAAHGSYIRGIPMMNENDCKVGLDANIPPFGACRSAENPNNEIIIYDANNLIPVPDESGTNYILPHMPVEGRLCTPILGEKWCDAKEDMLVDGIPALTDYCTIACSCGGDGAIIRFYDHGQGV